MIKHLVAPLVFTSLILTGCQSPQGKFTPEQVAAMQSYGFTESAVDWPPESPDNQYHLNK
ncbi:hypothetical protein EAI52_23155 [Escherichia coli]|nr:hypothetical protein EAI52_23155 [Escherichia coli]